MGDVAHQPLLGYYPGECVCNSFEVWVYVDENYDSDIYM